MAATMAWRGLFGLFGGVKRVLVGKDLADNAYYEIPQAGARARRVVDLKTPTRDGAKYDAGDVPVQWLAWLQHRRAAAPTLEELRASVERVATIQARAANVALRHDHERATLQAEHARLHAAAVAATAPAALPTGPGDGPDVPLPTTEPEGRGATFRPGQWTPGRVGSRGSGSAPS